VSSVLSRKIYAKATKRPERLTGATLREFNRAREWALMGTETDGDADAVPEVRGDQYPENGLAEPESADPPR
jgi:hypothetical protein